MNLVVLRGRLSAAPTLRQLASGDVVASFDVVSHTSPDERLQVPVTFAEPMSVGLFDCGDEVVVVGSVRRRFFRVGGVTRSTTEVVACEVIPAGHRRRVRAALQRSAERLGGVETVAVPSRRDSGQRRPPR